MGATPGTRGRNDDRRRRRRWLIIAVVLAIVVFALAVAVVWILFFGPEAPPAPTLDDALQVLQSATPSE